MCVCPRILDRKRERKKGGKGKTEQSSGHTDPISPPVKFPHASLSYRPFHAL